MRTITLRNLRKARGATQGDIGRRTGMAQTEICRIEKTCRTRVATLRRLVEAIGGKLELVATFGEERFLLDFEPSSEEGP